MKTNVGWTSIASFRELEASGFFTGQRDRILYVLCQGPMTRRQIGYVMNVTPSSLTGAMTKMIAADEIHEVGKVTCSVSEKLVTLYKLGQAPKAYVTDMQQQRLL